MAPGGAPAASTAPDSTAAAPMATTPPQTYPRCSATVHDECRQRN
jgi:hypothetical protein